MSATSLPRATTDLALPAICRPDRSLSTFQPSNVQPLSLPPALSTPHCPLPVILIRMNTCKSLSKQTTLTFFRNIDLRKTAGRGLLLLTRNPKKNFNPSCPEPRREEHRDEGPLLLSCAFLRAPLRTRRHARPSGRRALELRGHRGQKRTALPVPSKALDGYGGAL